MIILGSRELLVFSMVDGSLLSDHSLPCVPTQPLVLGDINNDVSDEFLVRCSDRSVHHILCNFNNFKMLFLAEMNDSVNTAWIKLSLSCMGIVY